MGSRRSRETSGRRRNPTVSLIRAHAQAPAAPGSAELADCLPDRRAATRLSFITFVTEAPANIALALATTTIALAAATLATIAATLATLAATTTADV